MTAEAPTMSPRPRSRPGREGKLGEGGRAIGGPIARGEVLIARCSNASLHPHPRVTRVAKKIATLPPRDLSRKRAGEVQSRASAVMQRSPPGEGGSRSETGEGRWLPHEYSR